MVLSYYTVRCKVALRQSEKWSGKRNHGAHRPPPIGLAKLLNMTNAKEDALHGWSPSEAAIRATVRCASQLRVYV
jgi:hypothetical protein